jgi:aryl-alcohol dehydrogenase-like predicted oxidoreductase
MKHRLMGRSGLQVSEIGLGCNNFGMRMTPDEAKAVVHKCLDLGIDFFDTAQSYGKSEEVLGEILGTHRKDVIVATKFGAPGWGPPDPKRPPLHPGARTTIMNAIDESLRKLRTDYIDLYYMHRPDMHTQPDETLRALDDLIRAGKVRYIGTSNFPAWHVARAQHTARETGARGFTCCQDHYSLLARDIEKELVPAIDDYGLGLIPYFPLASGLLSGKYKRGVSPPEGTRIAAMPKEWASRWVNDKNWATVERLDDYAQTTGHTMLQLAFGWLLAKPTVASVIAGATKPEQVEANVKAAEVTLSPDEVAELDRITAPGV